jgi:arylsulfatase A-like enzyme
MLADAPVASDRFPPADGGARRSISELSFLLPVWCGLVTGLLEVGTIVVRKTAIDANGLYGMTRHFVWLVPLTDLGIFAAIGAFGSLIRMVWPRLGPYLVARALCAMMLLPALLIAVPRIYAWAWLILALGVAAWLVPRLEARRIGLRRLVKASLPAVLVAVFWLAASPWINDQIKRSRADARPFPPAGSSNVVLIVLDTVAAGHLSLHGYPRATSSTLVELAEHGTAFDSAIAPSSWTLASHATMFTGRWLHELSVGWLTPLDQAHPTLAEYLGARGFATAGFVANTTYCARDTGLSRGFTHYDDYILPQLSGLKTAVVVNRALASFRSIAAAITARSEFGWLRPYTAQITAPFFGDRKGAAVVNREFLKWLERRAQPERPFFAFLNYFDAHVPYQIPAGRMHRFGDAGDDKSRWGLIERWGDLDKAHLPAQDIAIALDAYDDCIADLDEQVGKLVDELARRGTLDRTWLVITSDHGESFGEHKGVFCHGTSLYRTELHVPLLIIPPASRASGRVVKNAVTLRDLPATIVDILGLGAETPFPGSSLARYVSNTQPMVPPVRHSLTEALSELVPGDADYRDSYGLPEKTWPMSAIDNGEWSYIRTEGKLREELYHLSTDPNERSNLLRDPAGQPVIGPMRESLSRLTGGPLSPRQFHR